MRTAARPPDATAPAAAPSTTAPAVAPTTGTPSPTRYGSDFLDVDGVDTRGQRRRGGDSHLSVRSRLHRATEVTVGIRWRSDSDPRQPSSAGLPAGYEATIALQVISGTSNSATGPVDTMTALCGALVEKGATMKPCVPQTVNGLSVQRAEVDAPYTKIGTWANPRILYARPHTQVQYAKITIWNTTHPHTSQERAAAAAWIHAQNAKAALAATTPIN